jgi:DNA-binding CsgD family transcriptional regulator
MNQRHIRPRERAVLVRLALHNWEIAEQLEITPHTVKNHVTHLRDQFEETTRTAILVAALRAGVVQLDELVGGVS